MKTGKSAIRFILMASFFWMPSTCVLAQEATQAKNDSEILFVRRVGPLLREKCLGCHGNDPDEIEGSLDVRSKAGLEAGGDSGDPSIVPGKPAESPLFLSATRDSDDWSAMPPKQAEQLTEEQLSWLHDWIKSGAAWPSDERRAEIESQFANAWSAEDGIQVKTSGGLDDDWTHRKYDPEGLWAYQPVQKAASLDAGSASNPIDTLIAMRMPAGLDPAPRADRRTMIRRATFDLIGLPPTPAEVSDFVNDPRSDAKAFSVVVDRLLESAHYGERMAQHWLDVVRYADSSGFSNDFERGNAWRYRDYVVRAFNQDKPYDQFVREQIAGDELDSTDPEMIVATGFLRMGPWELTGMEVAKVARQRFLDDVTNSVGETFLGHSLQCARCHDHKFDPVPTRDYYSIQAVFATTQLAERKAEFLASENKAGFEEKKYLQERKQAYTSESKRLDAVLLENAQAWFVGNQIVSQKWDETVARLREKNRNEIFNAARSAMEKNGVPEDLYPPKLVGFKPQQFGLERVVRKGLQRLAWELERYQPYALAVYNGRTQTRTSVVRPTRVPVNRLKNGELERTCILTGGDPFAAAQPVTPGTLSVINEYVSVDIPDAIEGRRAAFAEWVANENNPLTTRVIVNRVWQWHFGEALAGNPNNFGSTGKKPTHPELLDWLAATFVDEGWSIKSLHRRIMLSEVYCRSSTHPAPAIVADKDPLGSSHAVFQPRRLSAEELRDSMLAITGELNPMQGGIPCRPEINQEVALQPRQVMGAFAAAWTPNPKPFERNRRSLYVLKLRGLMAPMLEVFNSPGPDFSCEKRETSTVTPQVFTLFNSQNTYSRALALADRAVKDSRELILEQNQSPQDANSNQPDNHLDALAIDRCFQLVLNRDPSEIERADFLQHWRSIESLLPAQPPAHQNQPLTVTREAVEENTGETFTFKEKLYSNRDYVSDLQPADVDRHVRALADLCLVLLNSNEFVYVY